MTIKEAISQLKNLRADSVLWIDPEDDDDVFKKDVEALDIAIQALERMKKEEIPMIDLIIGLAALGFMTVVFFIVCFTISGEQED